MKSRVFLIAALSVCAALVFAQGGGGAGGGQGRRGGLGQGFGRGGGFGQSELQLALRADVQKDLGVTAEQKTKLEALRPARGERGAGGGAGGVGGGAGGAGGGAGGAGGGQGRRGGGAAGAGNFDPAAMQARMEEQRAAQHKALAEILNADQMKRLGEIAVQLRGNRAILDPAVQKALNFTDAQKKQVADLMQKQQEANRSIREKVQNQEISREEMQAAMEKNNKVLDEEFGKVLTAEQAAKLKEMHGKPFKADLQPAGRGGGGGR